MRKYEAVIFDLDGTLLYTLEDLRDAINRTMSRFNFPTFSLEEVRQRVGYGLVRLMEGCVPGGHDAANFDEATASFMDDYTTHCNERTRPYDGIIEMLATLKEAGYALAIVSNKNDAAVGELCVRYFGNYVDLARGVVTGAKPKPAPDSVLSVLGELGIDRSRAIYVGDSDVDMMTAENAGMDYVLCAWGFKGRKFLESCDAAAIIDEPSELIGLIERV